jgi:invasion protein IalB
MTMIHFHSATNVLRAVARTTLFMLVAALVLPTAAQATPENGKQFKDWAVKCENLANAETQICHIFQNVVQQGTTKRIILFEVGYLPNRDQPVAILTVPLGIFLPAGVGLKVDEGKMRTLQPEVCMPDGCKVVFEIDAELEQTLKKGSKATIAFANRQRKALAVPISLKGFTAGLNSLK